MGDDDRFLPWLTRWRLTPDGESFCTVYAKNWLLPVRRDGAPAMLKLATSPEEVTGGTLMAWWDGEGAARVLELEGQALLLERLPATRSLAVMSRRGSDDPATRVLCHVGAQLHGVRARGAPPALPTLEVWLRALPRAAAAHGGLFNDAAAMATDLLAEPRDVVVMHGDLHHENVLDAGPRGWLAIDPKGVVGERTYDYVAMLSNPDPPTAEASGVLARRIRVICEAAHLEPPRLCRWLLAHSGASAAWLIEDGLDPQPALRMAALAKAAL